MNCNLWILQSALIALLIAGMNQVVVAGKDYYNILGISRDATDRQIKKAFRKLAIKFHPDKNKSKGAEEKFREIAEAYKILSDEKKRKQYDQFGEEGMKKQPGFEGFDFNFDDFFGGFGHGRNKKQQHNSGGHGFKFNFDDIFNSNSEEDEENAFQAGNNGFGGFGFGDDMFSFGGGGGSHSSFVKTEQRSSGGQTCRTVTKKMGNMVSTFTECS